jgi:hypothetical protein
MTTNRVEEEVVEFEITPRQLEEYSSRYERIMIDLIFNKKIMDSLGRMLIERVEGVQAYNQYMEFTGRLDFVLLMMEVIGKTVEWKSLEILELPSEEAVKNAMTVTAEILSCPGKSVRSISSSLWKSFDELSRREQARYLLLDLMIKEVCKLPYRVKIEVEPKVTEDMRLLFYRLLQIQNTPRDRSIKDAPGVPVVARIHTLIWLMAKLLRVVSSSRPKPLTRDFVVGYSTEVLRILENPLRGQEERYLRRVKELTKDGWTLGNRIDVESKTTPWLIPFEEAPVAALQRDRVMWAIVLLIIGYYECF